MADGKFLIVTSSYFSTELGRFQLHRFEQETDGYDGASMPAGSGKFLVAEYISKWWFQNGLNHDDGISWVFGLNSIEAQSDNCVACGGSSEINLNASANGNAGIHKYFVVDHDQNLKVKLLMNAGVHTPSGGFKTIISAYLKRFNRFYGLGIMTALEQVDLEQDYDDGEPDCTMGYKETEDTWALKAGVWYDLAFDMVLRDSSDGDDAGYFKVELTWDV